MLPLFAALLGGFLLAPWWVRRLEGIAPRTTVAVLLLLTLGEFVGGRAHFIVAHWPQYAMSPLAWLRPWPIHAGGAVVGLLAASFVCWRLLGVPMAKLADGLIPTVGLGIALARLGCFLHGCCFGTVTRLPWGIVFPPGSTVERFQQATQQVPAGAAALPVHPLQLYFAAAGLCVTALALWLGPRKRWDGQVALAGVAFFAASSFGLEFLRARAPVGQLFFGPFSQIQWVWAGLALGAGLVLAARRGRRPAPVGARVRTA